jgi:hypothetical protein
MPNASARLGLGAALLVLATGCTAPHFAPGDLGPRGRDMPAGPGLFSGPDGTFTIMERPIDRQREPEPSSLTTPPPETRSLTTPPPAPTPGSNAIP